MSEPKHIGCSRLAEILEDMSHDSVNRFLLRERYEPEDLFTKVTEIIDLEGGIISVDDTVIEKRYSNPECAELIGYVLVRVPLRLTPTRGRTAFGRAKSIKVLKD